MTIWLTLMIGPALMLICVTIHLSNVISTLFQSHARNIPHPPNFPCELRICHIIGVLEFFPSTAPQEPAQPV